MDDAKFMALLERLDRIADGVETIAGVLIEMHEGTDEAFEDEPAVVLDKELS